MNLRRNAALLASLVMSGLMPMGSGPDPEPVLDLGHRNRPPSPPWEQPPLTPEQIKAQEKRARKTAKMKGKP